MQALHPWRSAGTLQGPQKLLRIFGQPRQGEGHRRWWHRHPWDQEGWQRSPGTCSAAARTDCSWRGKRELERCCRAATAFSAASCTAGSEGGTDSSRASEAPIPGESRAEALGLYLLERPHSNDGHVLCCGSHFTSPDRHGSTKLWIANSSAHSEEG